VIKLTNPNFGLDARIVFDQDGQSMSTKMATNAANIAMNAANIAANTASLVTNTSNINGRMTHVLYPPAPLVAAKGDNITDDTTAIQNILANVNGAIYFGDVSKIYKISGTLTLDHTKNSLVGDGATLLFSNLGTAIAIAAPTANNYANTGYIQGLYLKNSNGGTVSGSKGLLFGGSTVGGHNITIKNSLLDGFYTGASFGNNAYIIEFENVGIIHSTWCVDYPSGLTNSGENITFRKCIFANSPNGVRAYGSEMTFTDCSFDYITGRFVDAEAGAWIRLNNCHVEGNSDTDYWLYASTASDTFIYMTGGSITVAGNKSAYRVGYGGSGDGGIYLKDVYFQLTGGSTYSFSTIATGKGRSSGILPFNNSYKIMGHDNDNLLFYGGFENNAFTEWTVFAGTALIDATQAHSGTYSLKFASASGSYISLYRDFSLIPGQYPRMGFWAKANFNGSVDNFTVLAIYYDTLGNSINPFTTTLTFSAAGTNPANWTYYVVSPTTPAPAGATKVRFFLQQASSGTHSDGLATMWFDDIIVTLS
jgi:hypothetical protein